MIERKSFGSDPDVSVVIPTIPSSGHQRVLSKLREQNVEFSFEVIIVNDLDLDICEARNRGIELADSEIVALTDDDCLPPQDWLSNIHSEYYYRDRHISCIEGPVSGGINYNGTRHYVGCNLIFNRDDALNIGGFDSAFAGYRDDTEFGWRMERESEGECMFYESVVMNHPDRPRSNYDKDLDQKLRRKYPEQYYSVFLDDYQERIYLYFSKFGITGTYNRIYNWISS